MHIYLGLQQNSHHISVLNVPYNVPSGLLRCCCLCVVDNTLCLSSAFLPVWFSNTFT